MTTYIALLRGINVSGHNKIKMVELKQLFIDLDFNEVTTYIQSGNVIFQSEQINLTKIEQQIIIAIKQTFGYSINVLILTKSELKTIFESNPFLERNTIDITKLHVTILKNEPDEEGITKISKFNYINDDEFKILNKSVYLHCPNGVGNSKLTINLFENKLKTSATSRNWRTITKLVELSTPEIE